MKIKLYDEWKTIITKAWSCRLMILLGVLLGTETLLPSFEDSIPKGIYAALTLFAIISRLIVQDEVDNAKQN